MNKSFSWVIQVYLKDKWTTVRVSACQSYGIDKKDETLNVKGKGLPIDFQVDKDYYHTELDGCDGKEPDYRCLSCNTSNGKEAYFIGNHDWSYCTLKELEDGLNVVVTSKKDKLKQVLRYLKMDVENDNDKVRFVYGFAYD
jgi:hypothetical protein